MTITLTREEAQQVLDALEYNQANWQGKDKAIETLLARLAQPEPVPTNNGRYLTGYKAQPEPEPVVYGVLDEYPFSNEPGWLDSVPLYTAPPQREWQGLTDEEIKEILDCGRPNLVNIKKAEQKLKEKNG
jgi:hypothetical protein